MIYKETPYSFKCPITGIQVYKGDMCVYDESNDSYISINAINFMEE